MRLLHLKCSVSVLIELQDSFLQGRYSLLCWVVNNFRRFEYTTNYWPSYACVPPKYATHQTTRRHTAHYSSPSNTSSNRQ